MDSPLSPLSLKKLNLGDFDSGSASETKRRRSSDLKGYVKVGSAATTPQPSPPSSPVVHVAREIKQDGGNVVRLQVSRNYQSAADAVSEHFSRSLSGEFRPPSPITSSKISATPPHAGELSASSSPTASSSSSSSVAATAAASSPLDRDPAAESTARKMLSMKSLLSDDDNTARTGTFTRPTSAPLPALSGAGGDSL